MSARILTRNQNAALVRIHRSKGCCSLLPATADALIRLGYIEPIPNRMITIPPSPQWKFTAKGERWINA